MSRGGFKRGKKLPGAEFSYQTEPGREPDTAPTPLFPKYAVPTPNNPSATNLAEVEHYQRLREKLHDGPFYAVLSAPPSYGKKGVTPRAQFDPFQGMATYGQRYMKKARTLPKLSAVPFEMNFFPKELWSTLDPNYVGLPNALSNGFGSLSKASHKRGFEDEEDEDVEDDGPRKKRNVGDDEDEGSEAGAKRALEDEDEDGEEEIVDDDFDEDEDEMGGDYNAEQYFDGGDEVGDGYDDAGGEDGDVY